MTTQSVREKSLPSRLVAAVTQRNKSASSTTVKKTAPRGVTDEADKGSLAGKGESLIKSVLSEGGSDGDVLKSALDDSSTVKSPTPPPSVVPRRNPGQPDAAKKFIDKKPTARVIGAALLEQLYKNNQVNMLATSPSTATCPIVVAEPEPGPAEPAMSSSDQLESVAQEDRCLTTKRSSLRTAQNTHRVPRVNKHLTFWGTEGAECTHVYIYEAVHVKLPWPGLKSDRAAKLASNEAWIKRKNNQARAVSAMAGRARLF